MHAFVFYVQKKKKRQKRQNKQSIGVPKVLVQLTTTGDLLCCTKSRYRQQLASAQHAQKDSVDFGQQQFARNFRVVALRKILASKLAVLVRSSFQTWLRVCRASQAFDAQWKGAVQAISRCLTRKVRDLQRHAFARWRSRLQAAHQGKTIGRHCLRRWLQHHSWVRARAVAAFEHWQAAGRWWHQRKASDPRASFAYHAARRGAQEMMRFLLQQALAQGMWDVLGQSSSDMARAARRRANVLHDDKAMSPIAQSPLPTRLAAAAAGSLSREGDLLRGASEALRRYGGVVSHAVASDMAWRRVGKLRVRGCLRHYLHRWRFGGGTIVNLLTGSVSNNSGTARAAAIVLRFVGRLRSTRDLLLYRGFQRWVTFAAACRTKVLSGNGVGWVLHRCAALADTLRARFLTRRFFWWKAQTFPALGDAALASQMHRRASRAVRERVRLQLSYAARTIFLLLSQGCRHRKVRWL